MSNYAIISQGKVVNMAYFADTDEGFDYTLQWGSDAYGVLMEEGVIVDIGYSYADGVFTPPPEPEPSHDELVNRANQMKSNLLSSADSIFLEWQTKLLLNITSEDEKNAVIAWVNYKDAVRAVDTQQAPDITWPEQPPIPESAQ